MDESKAKSAQEKELKEVERVGPPEEAETAPAESAKDLEEPGEGYTRRDEDGKIVPDYDLNMKDFDNGDIVEGDVVKVYRDEVLVDIDYKSEGVIPVEELSIRKNIDPSEVVSEGDRIAALVIEKEDMDGRLILSKKRADFEKSWDKVEKIAEDGGTVVGRVIEAVKGGLILDIGLRGFLPASLVEMARVKDLRGYIGKELECKVIETNRYRNNVVLSRRALLQEAEKEKRAEILAKLEKGQFLTGTVSNLANFGAFVDLGGIDGLIHISELSWQRIGHPSEAVDVGEEVKVQVLDVDEERGRVSLGLKQTQEDPWRKAITKYEVGQILDGHVVRTVPFGAFVAIEPDVEGLAHISELSEERLEDPTAVVTSGDDVRVKIIDIDIEKRRLSLSVKRAAAEEKGEVESEEETAKPEVKEEASAEATEEAKAPKVDEKKEAEAASEQDEAKTPASAKGEGAPEKKAAAKSGEGESTAAGAKQPDKRAEKEEKEEKAKPVLKLKEEDEEEKDAEPGSLEAIVADMKKDRSDDEGED